MNNKHHIIELAKLVGEYGNANNIDPEDMIPLVDKVTELLIRFVNAHPNVERN